MNRKGLNWQREDTMRKFYCMCEFGQIYHRQRCVVINHATAVTPETVPSQKKKEHLEETTDVVFEQFCTDVIAGNLHQEQKVLCMSKLLETYAECGKERGIDLSTIKHTMKKKQVERFPGLHFLKHNQRNRSELVYFHEMSLTKHTLIQMNQTTSSKISSSKLNSQK